MGGYTYIHCWGGVGRTGTIVGCLKARELKDYKDLDVLQVLRKNIRNHTTALVMVQP
jgi:protein-tyrosine phosphatase